MGKGMDGLSKLGSVILGGTGSGLQAKVRQLIKV